MKMRHGFTLAEVLITLGIIGVVAAMTIPTLMSNTNGAQFKSAYKKCLSVLNQAAIMNVALDDTDFSDLKKESDATKGEGEDAKTDTTSTKFMMNLLSHRMQSADEFEYEENADISFSDDEDSPLNELKAPIKEGESTDFKAYRFADGTVFAYNPDAYKCNKDNYETNGCFGFIDVNGAAGPNIEVECTNIDGAVMSTDDETCSVEASGIKDIYPVYFYGQQVIPATDAARSVLYDK